MNKSALLLLMIAWMATPGRAHANAFKHQPGTSVWKVGVSGVSGTVIQHASTHHRGIYKVGLLERSDNPLKLAISENDLNSARPLHKFTDYYTVRSGWFGGGGWQYANVGTDRFVTAVHVCVTNNKIKGIRLWGTRITSTGALRGSLRAEFARTNCFNNWKNKVSCGANKIATGIRAYYASSQSGFSGLTLECSKITRR